MISHYCSLLFFHLMSLYLAPVSPLSLIRFLSSVTHPTILHSETLSLYGYFLIFPYLAYRAIPGLCAVPALNTFLYILVAYCLYSPRLCQLSVLPHSARTPLIAGVDTSIELTPTSPLVPLFDINSLFSYPARVLPITLSNEHDRSRSKRSDSRHPTSTLDYTWS